MSSMAKDSEQIQSEVYHQLMELMDKAEGPSVPKDTWQVVRDISEKVPCPEPLKEQVEEYVKKAAGPSQSDPLIRVMAHEVLDALRKSDGEETPNSFGSTVDRRLSQDIDIFQVSFLDGSSWELKFDCNMKVSDAVIQTAWSVGVEEPERYALYEERDRGCLLLNQNKLLRRVLVQKFLSNGNASQRLVFKPRLSNLTEKEKGNQDEIDTCYVQCREQYIIGDYNVTPDHAKQLCSLLLQAYKHRCNLMDDRAFSKFASDQMPKCFPGTLYRDMSADEADLMGKVYRCIQNTGILSQEEARRRFLQVFRDLRCDDCFEATVQTGSDFPVEYHRETKVKLTVGCSCLLFSAEDLPECLLAIDFPRIKSFKLSECTLELETRKGEQITIQAEAENIAESIYTALWRHKKHMPYLDRENSSRSQVSTIDRQNSACVPGLQTPINPTTSESEMGEVPLPLKETGDSKVKAAAASSTTKDTSLHSLSHPENGAGTHPDTLRSSVDADQDDISKGRKEGYAELMGAVEALDEGKEFANYKILGKITGKPRLFPVQTLFSKEDAILKFFDSRSLFENSVYKHRRLKKCQHVCKMWEKIEVEGYPPCIAFEKGGRTLKYWVEHETPSLPSLIAAAYQIVLGLCELHSCGIVHCDLKPTNIVSFGTNTWKLLDLESSVVAGEPSIVLATPWYAAPEIIRAAQEGIKRISVRPSADMWSLGILLAELISGKKFYGEDEDPERIKGILCDDKAISEAISKILQCINEEERTVKRVIKNLLCIDPEKRWKAQDVEGYAVFKTAMGTTEKEEDDVRQLLDDLMTRCTQQCSDEQSAGSIITVISMAYLDEDTNAQHAFDTKEAIDVLALAKRHLDDNPIFPLKLGKSFLFHIALMPDCMTQMPIKVIGVKVLRQSTETGSGEAEGEEVKLTTKQHIADDRIEIFARLDPEDAQYHRLLEVPPLSDEFEEKKFQLKFVIMVSNREDGGQAFDLKRTIDCQLVSPDYLLDNNSFIQAFSDEWEGCCSGNVMGQEEPCL